MKTYLIALVAGLIPALATTNGAYAQLKKASVDNEVAVLTKNTTSYNESAGTADLSGINSKAIKNFAKLHGNITGESWDKTVEGFRSKFTLNGVTASDYYDFKGHWVASLKNYYEAELNKDVRAIVKRQYYDYAISLVQEIETLDSHNVPTYLIHVEDNDNYKILMVYDGSMEIYKEFKKQK